MYAHVNGLRGQPGHGEDGRGQAGPPGAAGLVGLFGSLPVRQLAGPAAVFFLWPPARARWAFPRTYRARRAPRPPRARAPQPGKAWWWGRRGVDSG
jgi:hypothetical protein